MSITIFKIAFAEAPCRARPIDFDGIGDLESGEPRTPLLLRQGRPLGVRLPPPTNERRKACAAMHKH